MDRLWTPWRYQYIAGDKSGDANAGDAIDSCVFCALAARPANFDAENFIVHRAEFNLIVLNIYPYTSGHMMVVPFAHMSDLDAPSKEITDELMDLTKRCQTALRETYHPHGVNLGMNLGSAAGAGVAGHIHMHILPRWSGDANFMTTIGETRVIPEDLKTTYEKLRIQFQ